MPYLAYTLVFMGTVILAGMVVRAARAKRPAFQPVLIKEDAEQEILKG